MDISNLFSTIQLIQNAQNEGRFLLKFTFPNDLFDSSPTAEGGEIDSPLSKSGEPSHIQLQRSASSKKHTFVPPAHTEKPDFSPEGLTGSNAALSFLSIVSANRSDGSAPDLPESVDRYPISYDSAGTADTHIPNFLPLTSTSQSLAALSATSNTTRQGKKRKADVSNDTNGTTGNTKQSAYSAASKKRIKPSMPARTSSR